MPTVYKVLAQSAPSAAQNVALYTTPSATQAVCSTLAVCNRGGVSATYRVAVRPSGASLANQHYIVYDAFLPAYSTDTISIGMTLSATDVVGIYASSADLSFSLFGSELT